MAGQKVFVSGVAGFLGSYIAEAFLADGREVVGVDNMIGGTLENVPSGIAFHQCDCNDFYRLKELMDGTDVVYHCAATAYEGLSVFSPHLVSQNIVTASTGMLSAAVANRVRRFVMCSSMARYGTNTIPFTEDMTPNPQDPYGIGKYASELLLRNLSETHGMEWVIAVPHNIIGPRQKYDDPYRNVASIFINLMLQGRQPIIYGDGCQQRCFSFVSDNVEPLKLMASSSACAGQVINIGPDDEVVSINELADLAASLIGFPLKATYVTRRPREVSQANCSADKARRLLGYEPKVSLEDGIKQMIEHVKALGPKPFKYHLDVEILNESTPVTWSHQLF